MVHFKASSLIETLVASAVFLTVFLLTLEATGRLGAIVAEEADWHRIETDMAGCRMDTNPRDCQEFSFRWGTVQFAFEVVTVGLWHVTQTACLKSGRSVRYEYWLEYE